jgi:hypothetical protein
MIIGFAEIDGNFFSSLVLSHYLSKGKPYSRTHFRATYNYEVIMIDWQAFKTIEEKYV